MMADGAGRDHGGDLGTAITRYGGAVESWIDLSTGINRAPYPLPPPSERALWSLPGATATRACAEAARRAYGAAPAAACLPCAGAQAAIGLVPGLRRPGRARVLAPSYNEHAAAFAAWGWDVREAVGFDGLRGADAAILVNPNNPDGSRHPPSALLALATQVGLLIVDESFADVDPAVSLCPELGRRGLVVLRSFGKFFGLAGLRLGFALGHPEEMGQLAEAAGPWPVSGPALEAGARALSDAAWAAATRRRLAADAARLDAIARLAGWALVGGTDLFRLYDTGDAATAQHRLARAQIWSRIFPYSRGWLRLGLPGPEAEWARLTDALGR